MDFPAGVWLLSELQTAGLPTFLGSVQGFAFFYLGPAAEESRELAPGVDLSKRSAGLGRAII